jgi:hypothetical protein
VSIGERSLSPSAQIFRGHIVEVSITKKHTTPSLKIEAGERAYYVPAPEGLKELVREIADQMTGK